jgi:toxin ParE1/3/4
MSIKPVVPRSLARPDVDEAVQYCEEEFGGRAAIGLIDALEDAFHRIGQFPAAGSPRYAHELGLPDLRSWPLQAHPIVIFYVERPTHFDVWRVLHAQRDIPASLHNPEKT